MGKKTRLFLYVFLDLIIVFLSWFIGLRLLSTTAIFDVMGSAILYLLGAGAIAVLFNFICRLYTGIWRYAGFTDAVRCMISAVLFCCYCVFVAITNEAAIPALTIEWSVITGVVYLVALIASRFCSKGFAVIENSSKRKLLGRKKTRVMLLGAGSAGDVIIREMKNSEKINMRPICVLDDDEHKIGNHIDGVKIVGKIKEVTYYAKKYNIDEIVVAIPSASRKTIGNILAECHKTSCKVKILPGVYQLADGQVSVSSIREVSVQDLLGREQVKVNLDEIMRYIEGRVVLVTGGGGSIGSELCRQIAEHNPKQLIIVDIYENNAYDIQQELLRHLPNLNLEVLIASVRDSKKISNLFEQYKPQLVFHAAAHKHVPLMEVSPNEAVKNNVSGTLKVAEAAGRNGVEKFILISTDKAVNPTNIMGATKRICEMIIQTMNKKYDTDYVAVRFGNVLGSNGSVIPLFKKQIAEGGPITVTHKDIVRYFMTIPEAVSLVLQAGAYAHGGEIFVLDMGEPVRIYDLAVNMIRLSGLEPYKDIDIKITGLRPGEKLYEERLMEEEGMQRTANEMISIGKPLEIDEKNLFDKINRLYIEAYNETDKMKELVHELVPTYKIDNRGKSRKSTSKTTSKSTSKARKPRSSVGTAKKGAATKTTKTKTTAKTTKTNVEPEVQERVFSVVD